MPPVAEEITVSDSGYTFPVEDILTGRGAIFGKSGSGKSNTATVVVEELLSEGLPLLIVDQDGEYYGLREEFELLHVGADANCDRIIGVDDAEAVADIALEENTPVILDVSGYMDEETAREIVQTVVRRLFRRENELKKPFLVLVEEIHEYVPEQGGHGELGEMLIRVAKRGRKRGLGICGISQRPASVSKNFITQCDWIVWHRLTWDNDTKVVGRILGSDYSDRVTELTDGEAYVMTDWGEDLRRVKFRLKRTHGGGGTPGLENLGDAADRPGVTKNTEESTGSDGERGDEDTDESDQSEDPAESETDTFPGTPSASASERGLSRTKGDDAGEDSQVTGPSPPPQLETNEGNPVWEFSQMVHYTLVVSAHKVRGGVSGILGAAQGLFRGSTEPHTSNRQTNPPKSTDESVTESEDGPVESVSEAPADAAESPPAWQRRPGAQDGATNTDDPRIIASPDPQAAQSPDGTEETEDSADDATDTSSPEHEEDGVDQAFVDRVLAKHDLGTDPDGGNPEEEDA